MRRAGAHRSATLAAAVTVVLLLGAGCGGDDSSGTDDFCSGIKDLRTQGAALNPQSVRSDDDVPEFKARASALADDVRAVFSDAPDEIADESAALLELFDRVMTRLDEATTVADVQRELPQFLQAVGLQTDFNSQVASPLVTYVKDTCPSGTLS